MHKLLLRYAVHHPRAILMVVVLVTAGALLCIPRIQLRLDGRSLIPAGEESMAGSDSAAATFQLKDIVVISLVAKEKEGMLTKAGVERIGQVSHELQETAGIMPGTVTSLTTMPLLRRAGGIIDPQPLIGREPVDEERLEGIRHDVSALGLDNGIIFSSDEQAAAVYCFAAADADREQLLKDVSEIASRNQDGAFDISIGGNALAQAELGRSVGLDLFLLVPFLVVALVVLMSLVFRNIMLALISLAEIGFSLVWTVGLIGLLDEPVFITTLALPVVLIAIGVTDDIYGLNRYIGLRRKVPAWSNPTVVLTAFTSVSKPVLLTALTTMSGLASLSFADLEPLRVFGIFGALAIGLSTLCTFTVVPALLVLRPPKLREGSARSNRRLAKLGIGLLEWVERLGPRRVVLGVLALSAVAFYLALDLRIDDSWVQNLSPGSDVARGDKVINQHLAGSTTVEFALVANGTAGFRNPEQLRRLAALEDSLLNVPRVGAVQSTYTDIVRITATLRGIPYDEFRHQVTVGEVVLTQDDIEIALAIDETLDRPHLGAYMTPGGRTARITTFVHGADYERLRPVLETARAAIAPASATQAPVVPFGDGWISYLTVKLLVEGQIFSIAFASLSDMLIVALMLRSLRTACVAVFPVVTGVLFTFVSLVIFDAPLGIASSMFASIALGIGVDYSIHLAVETREACRRAPGLRAALRRSYSITAPSIIVSACTITLGFAVLLLSSVVPNRMLGLLVCISLSICAAMTLVLVPGLAEIFGLRKTVGQSSDYSDAVQEEHLLEMVRRMGEEAPRLSKEGVM